MIVQYLLAMGSLDPIEARLARLDGCGWGLLVTNIFPCLYEYLNWLPTGVLWLEPFC